MIAFSFGCIHTNEFGEGNTYIFHVIIATSSPRHHHSALLADEVEEEQTLYVESETNDYIY